LEPPPARKPWKKKSKEARPKGRFGVRNFLKNQLFLVVFMLMHSIFSLYIRVRKAWHTIGYKVASIIFYHHRTPELIERDVKSLPKKPSHLSAVLTIEGKSRATELERLVNEAADLAVWSACAGVPLVSIYERSGSSAPSPSSGCHVDLKRRHLEALPAPDPPNDYPEVLGLLWAAPPRP
jgi:hypothetical protein